MNPINPFYQDDQPLCHVYNGNIEEQPLCHHDCNNNVSGFDDDDLIEDIDDDDLIEDIDDEYSYELILSKPDIKKFKRKVTPPKGFRMFSRDFDEIKDMRYFLKNWCSDEIGIICVDDAKLVKLNDQQAEILKYVLSNLRYDSIKDGVFYASSIDIDTDEIDCWSAMKQDIARSLLHIIYWLAFAQTTGIDIDKYIDNLRPDQEIIYQVIKDNFHKLDDVNIHLGTGLDFI